jgi:hypothetical protein
MKKGSIIRIVKSQPKEIQELIDMNQYIGLELPVLAHWKQSSNALENGEIQVDLPEIGIVVLNKEEYEEVK